MTVTAPRHRERWGKCLGAHDSQREDWPGWVGVRPLCTPPFYRWMKAPAWSWGPRSGCRTQCMSTWKTKADRRRWAGRKHVLSTDPTGLLASVSGTWPWPLTQSSWDTAPASPEHTCVLPGWLLLMLHFNNCLPLPLQLPVPGTLRRQQVTLTRTDGVGVGTVASVHMLPIYHPLWPSHSTAGQLMDRSDRTQGSFPPLVLSTDLKLGTFPPNEELTTYLEG